MKTIYAFLFFVPLVLFSSCSKEPDQLVSSTPQSYQKAIFIDPAHGSDDNNGREITSPVKTLFKASAYCASGDTLFMKGGIYQAFKDEIIKTPTEFGYIFIRPYPGESVILDGTGGVYTNTDAILTIKSSTYIDIAGFEIRNNTNGRGLNILSETKYCNFIKIRNCSIHDVGSSAIYMGSSNTSIENCEIYNSSLTNKNRALGDNGHWDAAIQSYFKYSAAPFYNAEYTWDSGIISGNNIHDNWGEGINITRSSNFRIANNKIYNCYNAAAMIDNSRDGFIFNNFIYSTGDEFNRISSTGYNRPMQGFLFTNQKNNFTASPMTENMIVYNNLLLRTSTAFEWRYDATNPIPANSYYNMKIIFNTCYNTIGYDLFALDVNYFSGRYITTTNEFRNNIFYKPVYSSVNRNYFTASGDYSQYWTITNNCFVSGDIPSYIATVNIAGNPSFVNPASQTPEGFKISDASICKRTGVVIPAVAQDYFMNIRSSTPSIGFFELLQ
ncbi:MAG: right-handed parallel beta-helix repeat-containing protein [Bacteroidetes bacterium]|nr:right-handed parallel beta-helix repeat-containing protein [Bacteroidota bacterium]